jgi:hypothetical protein
VPITACARRPVDAIAEAGLDAIAIVPGVVPDHAMSQNGRAETGRLLQD